MIVEELTKATTEDRNIPHRVERVLVPSIQTNWQVISGLAQHHPFAVRQLWLAADYQSMRGSLTFRDAIGVIRERVEHKKGIVRYRPNRRQVLGARREDKIEVYLGEYKSVGLDPVEIALTTPLEILIDGSPDAEYYHITPIRGRTIRLDVQTWEDLVLASQSPEHEFDFPTPVPLQPLEEKPFQIDEVPF